MALSTIQLFARRLLVAIEITGGLFHFLFFIATVITLGVLVPRNSNSFVWSLSVSGLTGWNNSGVTFCLGLLSPAFAVAGTPLPSSSVYSLTLSGFDGVLHMSTIAIFCGISELTCLQVMRLKKLPRKFLAACSSPW